MNDYWVLDENKEPRKASLVEWGEWMRNPKAKIVKQENSNGFHISTVFLGLDPGLTSNYITNTEPVFFETMIFGLSSEAEYQDRCCTYKQALEMHEKAVLHAMSKETDDGMVRDNDAPPDEIFQDMKKAATEVWSTYDNTHGYVDEKMDRVNNLKNIKDNAMILYRMFDYSNQAKMRGKLHINSLQYIKNNS